jgi:murein L,D-transpeptidase YcbB/YkuD
MRNLVPILTSLAVLLVACLGFIPGSESNASAAQEVRAALSAMLRENSTSTEDASLWHSLSQMYADRAFAPLWFPAGHPTSQASALTLELHRAEERGLRSTDYAIGRHTASSDLTSPTDIARADLELSLAAARFVCDLHSGRVAPRDVGYDLQVARPRFEHFPLPLR